MIPILEVTDDPNAGSLWLSQCNAGIAGYLGRQLQYWNDGSQQPRANLWSYDVRARVFPINFMTIVRSWEFGNPAAMHDGKFRKKSSKNHSWERKKHLVHMFWLILNTYQFFL